MIRNIFIAGLYILFNLNPQFAQQISIPRIEEMPELPQPYEMRDWQDVAQKYDTLVFNLDITGQYMPLTTIVTNTNNYPEHPTFGIQSYVGTNSPPGMEAINVIPAVVGATLSGIDKSNQYGYNWPLLCEEYFNRNPSQNIYLNAPNSSSGQDWWYETMPNVFFYQLNYLYQNTGDFNYQFITVAERWLDAVKAMGGNDTPWNVPYMNYRAFNLSNMTPVEEGVKQPEAAGAIGWLLYNAFTVTGEEKYRKGAEWCLEFLSNWNENPSYELQLPYGVYIAARMNAELRTFYDIEKMVNWCFDVGPLRSWGAIIGNWGGYDVHGLIGEATDYNPDYAFNMNGFEHVGALVPMARYDDRFAKAIGKWVLNVANASRLYYSAFLPDDMEDNEAWTSVYDPESVIAYEAILENPSGPYGTGDAMNGGWAETNLGLYGSSHIGILGAVLDKTNVDGILQVDMLVTDFYRAEAFPTYLFYNPHQEDKTIIAELPQGNFDIYDAVSNQVILTNIAGNASIIIPAYNAVIAVYLPAGNVIEYQLNKAVVQGVIIDYNAEVNVTNYPPRIKSLAISDSVALINTITTVYCTAEDKETSLLDYQWYINGELQDGSETFEWHVQGEPGFVDIMCVVKDEDELTDEKTITIKVVEKINYPPVIENIIAQPRLIYISDTSYVYCIASDQNGDELFYSWQAQAGSFNGSGSAVTYNAPDEQGIFKLYCEVTDTTGAFTIDSLNVLIKDPEQGQNGEIIAKYEFNGNAWDQTGNGHNGMVTECIYTDDLNGNPESAILFNKSNSNVLVQNTDDLNFKDGMSVSFWINVSQFYDHESYPISHGNWQTRWKVSIGNKLLRFTINGNNGIIDIDSETELTKDTWYHVVVLYDGNFCEIYLNSELDAMATYEGKINTTIYDLIFGQSLPGQSGFNFSGNLDNVRIYNYGISYDTIIDIYEQELSSVGKIDAEAMSLLIYPNPVNDILHVELKVKPKEKISICLYNIYGQELDHIKITANHDGSIHETISVNHLPNGIYMLYIKTKEKTISRKFVQKKY